METKRFGLNNQHPIIFQKNRVNFKEYPILSLEEGFVMKKSLRHLVKNNLEKTTGKETI